MSLTLVPHTRTVTPVSRADVDERLARILADAIVAEIRREMMGAPQHTPVAPDDDFLAAGCCAEPPAALPVAVRCLPRAPEKRATAARGVPPVGTGARVCDR